MVAAAAFLVTGVASAQTIVNSAHDLSTDSTSYTATTGTTAVDQVCIFCHTPHSATIDVPLWNHAMTAGSSTYSTYSSSTMNATTTLAHGGSTITNMCLSCHDGTVALTNFVNTAGLTTTNTAGSVFTATGEMASGAGGYLGIDLSNDHPVAIAYGAAGEGDLDSVANAAADGVRFFGSSGSETVECASCHDVHDEDSNGGYFLRVNNQNSELCLACHTK
jgi:predicted CXXCH cytochrome family protein